MKILIIFLFFIIFIITHGKSQKLIPRLDGKIIGGKEVSIRAFPYQASVRFHDIHICGGSIISETVVLSAAHCTYNRDYLTINVRVGHNQHAYGENYKLAKIYEHPEYNKKSIENDISVLIVETPMTLSTSVKPVELQPLDEEILPDTEAWVSGWGVTKEGSHSVPNKLRAVLVLIIPKAICEENYKSENISDSMLCATAKNRDACQGDSGGPLVHDDKLIGIVSWGYGCARPEFPGVYTKISFYHDWIKSIIE